jgi:hypothetical protein
VLIVPDNGTWAWLTQQGRGDLALNPVGERVERADHIMPVRSHIEREVVARPGRDAHKWDPVRRRCRSHHRQRPVAASHAQRGRSAFRGFADQCGQVLARARTTVSIRRSRARSAIPAPAALPPPDLGLTNNTGWRGGSAGRQPEVAPARIAASVSP